MIYITGDKHGDFSNIQMFCERFQTQKSDILIILGDAGINYYDNKQDIKLKEQLAKLPITFFCIHGNHENRPQNILLYRQKVWNTGIVFIEENYPNILFAKDGCVYDFNGLDCMVIGGAYSVDKFYRLERGYGWWKDEQPSESVKKYIERKLKKRWNKIDIILSHTCPLKYEPIEVFLPFIDQTTVDKSTEQWLDKIEDKLDYKKWCCGHYHIDKKIDRMVFMYNNIVELNRR